MIGPYLIYQTRDREIFVFPNIDTNIPHCIARKKLFEKYLNLFHVGVDTVRILFFEVTKFLLCQMQIF